MSELKKFEKLFTEGKITRREFMGKVSALGLAAAVSPVLLSKPAQAETPKKGGRFRMGLTGGHTTDNLDPATLTEFYRRVRPQGFWGPVARLCPEVEVRSEAVPAAVGWIAGMALTFGLTLALGFLFVDRNLEFAGSAVVTVAGAIGVAWALRRIRG